MLHTTNFDNMLLRIDCNKAEDGLKTTPNSQCALNALAIDNPMEYARLVLDIVMYWQSTFLRIFRKIYVEYKNCAWYNGK